MGEWRRWTAAILGCVTATAFLLAARQNPDPPAFEIQPDYTLTGNAIEHYLGDPAKDMSGRGVALRSTGESGSVAKTVSHLAGNARHSFRFSICGLPQDGFSVRDDAMYLKVEFLGVDGTKSFDAKTKSIYPLIQQARHDLNVNGIRHAGGAAVWTTYSMDFVIPFAEVDELRLSVNFENGNGHATARDGGADFYISKFDLTPLADAPNIASTTAPADTFDPTHLISLGGRWSYAATADESSAPTVFDAHNATRLLYHDDRYSAPFAGMMSSTLRAGEKDSAGVIATADQSVDDNVTVQFQGRRNDHSFPRLAESSDRKIPRKRTSAADSIRTLLSNRTRRFTFPSTRR